MVLSAIQQYPTRAYAGLIEGMADGKDLESYINNAGDTAGAYLLTPTVVNSHTYTFTAYGIPVSYASDSSATAAEVRDGLIAAVVAIPALAPLLVATASGNNVLLTEVNPENGPANVGGLDGSTALSTNTAHSQLEPMPAGIIVVGPPTAGLGFQDCRLPRVSGTVGLLGLTVHQHAPVHERQYPSPSALLYPPRSTISVAKRAKVWCVVEEAVALTDTPYFRYAAGAGGTQLGAIRKSADTSTAQSLSGFAKFRTAQATAGGIALVEVNIVP